MYRIFLTFLRPPFFLLAIALLYYGFAQAGPVTVTNSTNTYNAYVLAAGYKVEHRAQGVNSTTLCDGLLCANLWLGQTLAEFGGNNQSRGNEVDFAAQYTSNTGKVAIFTEYAFYVRMATGATDLHSAILKATLPLGHGWGLYTKGQFLVTASQGGDLPYGGLVTFTGLTKDLSWKNLSCQLVAEAVHDGGVAGDEVGWLGRFGVSPSFGFTDRLSLDLGFQRFQQLDVSDRGNHWVTNAGITWHIKK